LDGIYAYIAQNLREPGSASDLLEEIEKQILSLEYLPLRCPERRIGVYAGKGYRQLLVQNYNVIYRVDEVKKVVLIVTVRYSKSGF
jgi:plasmid stabilization system protein ParE